MVARIADIINKHRWIQVLDEKERNNLNQRTIELMKKSEKASQSDPDNDYSEISVRRFMKETGSGTSDLEIYKKYAKDGLPSTQRKLGLMYAEGQEELKKNEEKSFLWFYRAALNDDGQAMFYVGLAFLYAKGVKQNVKIACYWLYKAAAEHYETQGYYHIGRAFANGMGDLPADDQIAWIWFQNARNLDVVERDYVSNFESSLKKQKNKVFPSLKQFPNMIENKEQKENKDIKELAERPKYPIQPSNANAVMEATTCKVTSDTESLSLKGDIMEILKDINQALADQKIDKEIQELIVKAEKSPDAQSQLGVLFYKSNKIKMNYTIAFRLFEIAEKNGHMTAKYNLGRMYAEGNGVEKSEKKAVELYQQVAESGIACAQYSLGFMFEQGRGIESDFTLAQKWYKKASDQRFVPAMASLGYLYGQGLGVAKDIKKAIELFTEASDKGNAVAKLYLGFGYSFGKWVVKNVNKGQKLIEEAIKLGLPKNALETAQNYLKQIELKARKESVENKELKDKKEKIDKAAVEQQAHEMKKSNVLTISPIPVTRIEYKDITIIQTLASGGYGTVKKATSINYGVVAVKEFIKKNLDDRDFKNEIRIMANLKCPNVVQFLGYCESPLAIVMEFMSSGSLYDCIRRKELDIAGDTLIHIAQGMARGLGFLHKNQIIHRDLKSLNILMDGIEDRKGNTLVLKKEGLKIKISDFGISKFRPKDNLISGGKGGSLPWMSPEGIHHVYGFASDIWSLGTIFWELYSRKLPFSRCDSSEDILNSLKSDARPGNLEEDLIKNCPELMKNLIKACWHSSPEKRPTANRIIAILNGHEEDIPKPLTIAVKKEQENKVKLEHKQQEVRTNVKRSTNIARVETVAAKSHSVALKATVQSPTNYRTITVNREGYMSASPPASNISIIQGNIPPANGINGMGLVVAPMTTAFNNKNLKQKINLKEDAAKNNEHFKENGKKNKT